MAGHGVFEFIERLRFEDRQENFDFNSAAHSPTDDSWFVQRFRAGLTWKSSADFSLQVQLQDVREWGSERPKVPFILGAEGNDALDLRIASVTWGDPKKTPVVFTLGRQVLSFGEERLVGPGDWNNFARTFDAGKLTWSIVPGKTTATLYRQQRGPTSRARNLGDGWKFDHSSSNDIFSGVYVTTKLDQASVLDGYLLWRDKKDNNPIYNAPTTAIPAPARTAAAYDIGQDVFTLGTRFLAPPKEGEFDSEFEGAWQWGHCQPPDHHRGGLVCWQYSHVGSASVGHPQLGRLYAQRLARQIALRRRIQRRVPATPTALTTRTDLS